MNEIVSDVKIPLATFGDRLKAALLPDYLIPIILFIAANIQFAFATDVLNIVAGIIVNITAVVLLIGTLIIQPLRTSGQSPGKKRNNIRIMVIENKETWSLRPVNSQDVGIIILRAIVGWIEAFFFIPVLIPWLLISNDKNNQRLADKIAGTVVVVDEPGMVPEEAEVAEKAPLEPGKAVPSKIQPTRTAFEAGSLFKISKIVLIVGASFVGLAFLIISLLYMFEIVDRNIFIFGGVWNTFSTGIANLSFTIISYVFFFITAIGLGMFSLSLDKETRKPLLIGLIFYVLFIIFSIITNHIIAFNIRDVAYVNITANILIYGISVSRLILRLLSIIFLIVFLFLLNNVLKKINGIYNLKITTFKAQYSLIIFAFLYLVSIIIGISAGAQEVFALIILYLVNVSYLGILISILVSNATLIRLRKISI